MEQITHEEARRLLKSTSTKLDQASRGREHSDMDEAQKWLEKARQDFAYCDQRTGPRVPNAISIEYWTTRAGLQLVDAIVLAHTRDLRENNTAFNQARDAANHKGLPPYMLGQVLCCWGAVLVAHGEVKQAILHLEMALAIFQDTCSNDRGFINEVAQSSYHLARAYCIDKRRRPRERLRDAIKLLEQAVPKASSMGRTEATTAKYQLAAMIMLAALRWKTRQPKEAQKLYKDAKRRGLVNNLLVAIPKNGPTLEGDRLTTIELYGFRSVFRGYTRRPNRLRTRPKCPEI